MTSSVQWPKRVVQEDRNFYGVCYATKNPAQPVWNVHLIAADFEEALEAARLYLRQNSDRFERIVQLTQNHGVEIMRIEEGMLS